MKGNESYVPREGGEAKPHYIPWARDVVNEATGRTNAALRDLHETIVKYIEVVLKQVDEDRKI